MRKKLIISTLAVLMLSTTAFANEETQKVDDKNLPAVEATVEKTRPEAKRPDGDKKGGEHAKKHDDKLKLTDEQREQAKAIHKSGHDKIKPIFEEMKVKKDALHSLKDTKLSEEEKKADAEVIKKELKELKESVKKVQVENMKEFEAILTPDQKKEFKKMKKEGEKKRKEMEKKHKKGDKEFKGERGPRPDGERGERPEGPRGDRPDGERGDRPEGPRGEGFDGPRGDRPDGEHGPRPEGPPPADALEDGRLAPPPAPAEK